MRHIKFVKFLMIMLVLLISTPAFSEPITKRQREQQESVNLDIQRELEESYKRLRELEDPHKRQRKQQESANLDIQRELEESYKRLKELEDPHKRQKEQENYTGWIEGLQNLSNTLERQNEQRNYNNQQLMNGINARQPSYGSPSTRSGTPVYNDSQCIGAVVNGRCLGTILPSVRQQRCYGAVINGECLGTLGY